MITKTEFKEHRDVIAKSAWDRGCNIALVDALRWCRNMVEIKQTLKQASGVGAERLRDDYLPAVEKTLELHGNELADEKKEEKKKDILADIKKKEAEVKVLKRMLEEGDNK